MGRTACKARPYWVRRRTSSLGSQCISCCTSWAWTTPRAALISSGRGSRRTSRSWPSSVACSACIAGTSATFTAAGALPSSRLTGRHIPAVRGTTPNCAIELRMSISSTPGVHETPTTPGLCECGCGNPTRIARWSDPRHGHVKGQPVRFLKGHSHRRKVVSAETRAKLSAANKGSRNYSWRGDQASYRALHGWLCIHHPKKQRCEECGRSARKTDYALIPGRSYTRNRGDYRELCHPCHMRQDNGGRSILSDVEKENARIRYSCGETQASIAASYGVSASLIGKIVRSSPHPLRP